MSRLAYTALLAPSLIAGCALTDDAALRETTSWGSAGITPDTPTFRELTIAEELASGGVRRLRIRGLVVGTLRSAGAFRACRAVVVPSDPAAAVECADDAVLSVKRAGRLCETTPTACAVQLSPDGTYPLSAGAIASGRAACGPAASSQPCFRFELAVTLKHAKRESTYFVQSVPTTEGGDTQVAYGSRACGFMPSTGYVSCDSVLRHWISRGGADVLGDPTSDERMEVFGDGVHRRAQWFRKGRLEIIAATPSAPVRANDLGRDWLTLTGLQPPPAGAPAAGCTSPPGAAFAVCPPFVDEWTRRGGASANGPGLPLSGQIVGRSEAGEVVMQVFERARLEAPSGGGAVAFGNLGDAVRKLRSASVSIPAANQSSASRYGIDETEVSRRQYEAWLGRGAPGPAPAAACADLGDQRPNAACEAAAPLCEGEECLSRPQTCVTWCNAAAYCAGMGRRLCGRVGGTRLDAAERAAATKSEWLNACTSAGKWDFPYGSAVPREAVCHDDTIGSVGSRRECQSVDTAFRGVLDQSANVWEWDDSCDDPSDPSSLCYVRGGAAGTGYGRCSDIFAPADGRLSAMDSVGFRCCGTTAPSSGFAVE